MGWSGGTFTRSGGADKWKDDRDAGVEIEAGIHDTHDNDLASGINACLKKDGGNAATGDLDLGSNKITNLTDPTADQDAATKKYVDDNTDSIPPGVIAPYAGTSAPAGWLLCDGSSVSTSTYSALEAVIGTTYGNSGGAGTFDLPDLRGRTVFGKEASASRIAASGTGGFDSTTLGDTGGDDTVTLSDSNIDHYHHAFHAEVTTDSSGLNANNYPGDYTQRSNDFSYDIRGDTEPPNVGRTSGVNGGGAAGSRTAHNNMPPGIILNWIIKT